VLNFKLSILYFITLEFIFISCNTEEINSVKLDITFEKQFDIVIEGFITTEKMVYQVKLSKPTSLSNSDFIPIDNAQVKISDGKNSYDYKLTDIPGVFQTIDSISGKIGTKYTLIVEYNNKTYYATDSLIACNLEFDFPIEEMIDTVDSYIMFNIPIHNFGYKYPSIWNFIESTNDKGEINHFDINNLNRIKLYNHIGSIPQGIFPSEFASTGLSGHPTDSLELIKFSISNLYNKYLLSQFNISDWSSGIFSTVPGNTKTNVSEGGIGFFYCSDVKRFKMTYQDLKLRYEKRMATNRSVDYSTEHNFNGTK